MDEGICPNRSRGRLFSFSMPGGQVPDNLADASDLAIRRLVERPGRDLHTPVCKVQ